MIFRCERATRLTFETNFLSDPQKNIGTMACTETCKWSYCGAAIEGIEVVILTHNPQADPITDPTDKYDSCTCTVLRLVSPYYTSIPGKYDGMEIFTGLKTTIFHSSISV